MPRIAPTEYMADVVIPPGDSIRESMESMGITQAELAARLGRPPTKLNEIIQGKRAITEDTALALERVFPYPAEFWLNLEKTHRLGLARSKESEGLERDIQWMRDTIPVGELIKRGRVPNTRNPRERLMGVLRFFGLGGVDIWKKHWGGQIVGAVAFRRADRQASIGRIASWLRLGELDAQGQPCRPFNKRRFLAALKRIRAATAEPPKVFEPLLGDLKDCGVVVSLVREIPGAGISGATRWLTPSRAHIQLSLQYKTDDQFWFTFFHEAGHVVLHDKADVFLEGAVGTPPKQKEGEANRFAADFLIPRSEAAKLSDISTREQVIDFAGRLGIAPGIVAGRLQHDGYVTPQLANYWQVKRRLDWQE